MNIDRFLMKTQLMSKACGLILAIVIALAITSNASATTMISMNIAQLAEDAQKAFVTRIQSVKHQKPWGDPAMLHQTGR